MIQMKTVNNRNKITRYRQRQKQDGHDNKIQKKKKKR